MFCKWCGGNLTPSDSKCKRCGKDVPALSDCGGFYDLVSDIKKPAEIRPVPKEPITDAGSVKQQPKLPKDAEPVRTKKANKKTSWNVSVLTLLGVAVVLVILFMMNGKINQYSDDIKSLRGTLSEIVSELDALEFGVDPSEGKKPDEMTDTATNPVEPEISEQDISFTFALVKQHNTKEYLSDFDLGECRNAVSVTYAFDDETDEIASAIYSVKNAGHVELCFRHGSEPHHQSVSVTYRIDEAAFGLSVAPESCEWEYRTDDTESWLPVSEDVFTQTDISGETRLSIIDSGWDKLVDNNKDVLELRCKIVRTNTDGGSITLYIEGIVFYPETNDEVLAND